MARGRMLSKSLGASRKFAKCGKSAGEFPQLLFALLIPHTDDFGRMTSDAFTVKHAVFPTSHRTEEEFEAALVSLEEAHLIVRYDHKDGQVLQVVKFEEHQRGLNKRTRSDFPAPPVEFREILQSGDEVPPELKGTEPKGNPPKPPADAGGVRPKASDIREAKKVRSGWGLCMHRPSCDSLTACIDAIARELATKRLAVAS